MGEWGDSEVRWGLLPSAFWWTPDRAPKKYICCVSLLRADPFALSRDSAEEWKKKTPEKMEAKEKT